jgi:ribosome-associated protein
MELPDLSPWIEARFDRSSGPGGQNVNKVSTRVTLLLDFERCAALSAQQKASIRAGLSKRLASDGRLRVVCQSARTQIENRAAARERLHELLRAALRRPTPRKPSRPSPGSRVRRLRAKRSRGEVKRQRQAPSEDA